MALPVNSGASINSKKQMTVSESICVAVIKWGWMELPKTLLVSVVISTFFSIAFATVIGGLLDYGLFETYLIVLTGFTLADPAGWLFFLILYSPLVLALISLAMWGLSIFEVTER